MQAHQTGPIRGTRLGAEVVHHTFPIDYTNATGVAIKVATIDGTTQEPIFYRGRIYVETNNNSGTTATLTLGTTSGGTEILTAQDVRSAAGVNSSPAAAAENKLASAATDIYCTLTMTGTAATAGRAWIILELFSANTKQPNVQGD